MGSTVMLNLVVGPYALTANVDSSSTAQMGETLDVVLDMSKSHVFDPETTVAVF
jgi:hypothetical protein